MVTTTTKKTGSGKKKGRKTKSPSTVRTQSPHSVPNPSAPLHPTYPSPHSAMKTLSLNNPPPSSTSSLGGRHSPKPMNPDMENLLSFYKRQCEANEAQINNLVQSIADLDPAYDELSKARRLVEDKTGEITRLHDYASSLNTAIISEKEKGLNLQGEVERLRIVEMELKRENDNLMDRAGGGRGVTKEEVTFYRDCRPERLRRNVKNKTGRSSSPTKTTTVNSNSSTLSSPAKKIRGRLGPKTPSSPSSPAAAKSPTSSPSKQKIPVHHAHTAHNTSRQVLRTVYLPNERADALVLMVESLSSQLEEHKVLAKVHLRTIADEFKEREENYKARIAEDQVMIETLSNRCDDVERKWRNSVQSESKANAALQTKDRLEAERQMAGKDQLDKLREERDELAAQLEKNKNMLKSHSQVHHRNLLHQVAEREKDVHNLREQYRDLQKVYDEKLESLEIKAQQSKERFKSLEERRKIEIASFQKDISFFKNNIRQLERELMIKKKEEVQGGRSWSGSTLSRGRSSSQISLVGEEHKDEKTRNATIIRHITDYGYNPAELPENESFYGGLSGKLHEDVHSLKQSVQSLSKEIIDDGGVIGDGGTGVSPRSPGGRMRVESGERVIEVDSTSARRGSYFGSEKVERKSMDLGEAEEGVLRAWVEAGRGES
ncbi:hypothetical protein TL16_g05973 [Triparma laevis f. inornata]|uniref:Uncharacterized protein n=1 Tax=Triparma laevis f. inornata TaxID=1714386 RepID=A0A9W7AI25_9STRA|nr:hypothetical protein TL16_g05973 [Triparma laevis f. inornata]